jgi:hypothetical protein
MEWGQDHEHNQQETHATSSGQGLNDGVVPATA